MHESRNHQLFQQFGVMLRATACGCVIENILVASRTFRRADLFRDVRGADFIAIPFTQLTLNIDSHAHKDRRD